MKNQQRTEIDIDQVSTEEREKQIYRQTAKTLINSLVGLQRLLKIYNERNTVVARATDALFEVLNTLSADGTVEIGFWRGCIFVNGERIRCDVSNFNEYKHMLAQASKLKIAKITIARNVTIAEIIAFATKLNSLFDDQKGAESDGFDPKSLSSDHIGVTASEEPAVDLEDLGITIPTPRERAINAFYTALETAKEILTAQTKAAAINLKKAKRAVQAIADALIADEATILALAAIKDHDEYTFTHSVNVCVLSLSIGQRLALEKEELSNLGIASLFHDIGKVGIPTSTLNKTTMLDGEEWKSIMMHTVIGARKLSRISAQNDSTQKAMIVAFQHHLNQDLSGYPRLDTPMHLDTFSKIVRICDTFDAMTTQRPYRNKVYSPYDAMRYLLSEAGRKFDSMLVKAMATVLGIFPVGTVVKLNTGEIAIVLSRSRISADLDRPIVRVVADSKGRRKSDPIILDLGAIDPRTGDHMYSITAALSCNELSISPRDYLLF